jgi:hypothetical protein
MDVDDIGFEYINRQHLFDLYNKQYGHLAKVTTDLGMSRDPDNKDFLRTGTRTGQTEPEIQQLIESQGEEYVDNMLEQNGLSDTPENRAMLQEEFANWAYNNLAASENYSRILDPRAKEAIENSGGTGGVLPEPKLKPLDQQTTIDPNFTPKQQTAAVLDMGIEDPNSKEVKFLDKAVAESKDEALQESWDSLKELSNNINIPFAPPEQVSSIRSQILERVFDRTWFANGRAGDKDAYTDIRDILVDNGIIEEKVVGDLNQSQTFYVDLEGNKYTDKQLEAKMPKDFINTYKKLDRIPKMQIEQLGDLYNPGAVTHSGYVPTGEGAAANNQALQELVKNSLGTKSFAELSATGIESFNDKGKKHSENKTKEFLKTWREELGQGLQQYNSSVLPGTAASPPSLEIRNSKGESLKIPLQREVAPLLELGTSGNIIQEVATSFGVPDLVDSDINYVAGQMFRKSNKRSLELSELLGGPAAGASLGTIKKEDSGVYSYTAPGATPIVASSPANLLRSISNRFTRLDDYYKTLVSLYATPKQLQAGAASQVF